MLSEITIQGLVQGVGFRPFIYLLAEEMGIKGTVANRNNGVIILAELSEEQQEQFIHRIRTEHPPTASIHRIEIKELHTSENRFTDFSIVRSYSESDEVTQVAPDIAVCDNCLNDRKTQKHRIQYPFVNCTHCGPRFSIIRDLPYDRNQTTMSVFEMCSTCRDEYTNIRDRRFHAQPVACNQCGPKYYYTKPDGGEENDYRKILDLCVRLLNDGKIITVKGIGGYHLVCDATNESAVNQLRKVKIRDTKPFALMFKDIESMSSYAFLNKEEETNLKSWRRPIVLLKQRPTENRFSIAHGVNPGMRTLGCMLPYMPIHYDWFQQIESPALVMTSGNLNDQPIIVTPEEAEQKLENQVALVLHHNRPIHNRVDDSVLQVCGNVSSLLRRSRGYAPEPFFADIPTEGILAFGAEKTNTFALGKGDTIIQSQHIGDLKNEETFSFYTESMERFQRLFRFTPRLLACDLHPDYLSSIHAETMSSEKQIPLIKVQHHHAHAVACMLEHHLNQSVIAVVWDGTGLGDDGAAWGGEFFLCDRKGYTRLAYPEYVPMPGGDKAALEPWRMAVAYLHHYQLPIPEFFMKRIGKEKIEKVVDLMNKKINSPLTSSIGRLFDGFASLIGICDMATRQAEAAVLLEQCADYHTSSLRELRGTKQPKQSKNICEMDCFATLAMTKCDNIHTISFRPLFQVALKDLEENVSPSIMAAKFHNTLANLIVEKVCQLSAETGVKQVVVSGGCFQNKRLTEQIQQLFSTSDISLYQPSRIPCNDGGIAIGQLAVTAALLQPIR